MPTKATGCTLFRMTYEHEVVFPLEINMKSLRVAKQNMLSFDNYQ